MASNDSMVPLAKKLTKKIFSRPGFSQVTVTEATKFSTGTLRRSVSVTQSWQDNRRASSSVSYRPGPISTDPPLQIGAAHLEDSNEDRRSGWKFWFMIIGIGTLFLLPALLPKYSNVTWRLDTLITHLKAEVYGQDAALSNLVYSIDRLFLSNDTSGVIVLTGTNGVGKTLTSSIIQKEYPWQWDVHLKFASRLEFEKLGKPLVKHLFIFEDCNEYNSKEIISIVTSMFHDAQNLKNPIIFLLVFTYKLESQLSVFLSQLRKDVPGHFHVPFQALDRDTVRKCFERQLIKMQSTIEPDIIEKLVDKHMTGYGGEGSFPGCKLTDSLIVHYLTYNSRPGDKDDSFFS